MRVVLVVVLWMNVWRGMGVWVAWGRGGFKDSGFLCGFSCFFECVSLVVMFSLCVLGFYFLCVFCVRVCVWCVCLVCVFSGCV